VFIAQAVFEEFFSDDDISTMLNSVGYNKVPVKKIPYDIAEAMKIFEDLIDTHFSFASKRYYINELTGAFILYGVESNKDSIFVYAINVFYGNIHAVERIREFFSENEFFFEREMEGGYMYATNEDATEDFGFVAIYSNEVVIFGYFEP
jgi:hypothetical protein